MILLGLLALPLACDDVAEAPDPGLTPAQRLDRLVPGLSLETAKYTQDLGAVADVLERVDPSLRAFFLPKASGTLTDDVGEVDGPDIATVTIGRKWADGAWRYSGHVEGVGLDRVQIYVDDAGGPAPDVRIDLGNPVFASAVLPGGTAVEDGVAIPGTASHDRHGWDFAFGLPGPANAHPVAFLVRALGPEARLDAPATPERDRVDDAAGGVFGATGHTVELVVALLARAPKADPDLLVAVAADFGPWLDLVDPSVRPTVVADANARVAYAGEVDAWLAKQGVAGPNGGTVAPAWRVQTLGPVQKLLWAWPGGEGAVYGARPLAWESGQLSAEAYRFHVADVATLRTLRDGLPLAATASATADARDTKVWADLDYRADDAGMQALCDSKRLDRRTCFQWGQEKDEGRSLGTVDGVPVPLWKGTSASYQTARWRDDGSFSGDCASATSVMITALQAVGLSPLAFGWAGETWNDPTHNLPLVWDGARYRPTQAGPSGKWNAHAAFVYATVPVLNAHALLLGWAGFGAAGPAVPSAQVTYQDLNGWLADGVAAETVLAWLNDGYVGAWPQIR